MSQSQKRISAFKEIMAGQMLDGAIFTSSSSFAYLLGLNHFPFQRTSQTKNQRGAPVTEALNVPDCLLWLPTNGEGVVFATTWRERDLKDCPLPVVICYADTFAHNLRKHLTGKKIAIGDNAKDWITELLKEISPNCIVSDAEEYCLRLRRYKDSTEIELLTKVAKLTDKIMGEVLPYFKGGITPCDAELLLSELGRKYGAEDVAFSPGVLFVKSGHESAETIIGYPKDMPLQKGTSLAFDFGYVLDGYCSDFGRSFYFGDAPKEVHEGYLALQKAQCKMINSIIPGKTNIQELDGMVRQELYRLGFGENMTNAHNGVIGHQIGIDCHELPWLNRSCDFAIEPNMVFCTEPKMWFPNTSYIRVEDMVLVTETGAVSLTEYDREQFQL